MSDLYEIRRLIKYSILQITIVPSLFYDLLLFMYFFKHWRRQIIDSPCNHAILCLLITSFIQKVTDAPAFLFYLRWGTVPIHDATFCSVWNWIDYSANATCLHLLTWCCIERHLFIFHSTTMKKMRYLILLHYIPLIIALNYVSFFYAFIIFLPTSCVSEWDYSLVWCGYPCYVYWKELTTFDWLFHCVLPNISILICNMYLFVRIIWQKIKRRRPIRWYQQRKLIIQLLMISSLYIIFYLPMVIVGLIQALWEREFLADVQNEYFYFLIYFTTQFLPFVIASQLPGFRHEWLEWLKSLKRQHQVKTLVHPTVAIIQQDENNQTNPTLPNPVIQRN